MVKAFGISFLEGENVSDKIVICILQSATLLLCKDRPFSLRKKFWVLYPQIFEQLLLTSLKFWVIKHLDRASTKFFPFGFGHCEPKCRRGFLKDCRLANVCISLFA